VLDDVERGRFLEQPAGKHRAPGELRVSRRALFDKHLHKGPGLGRIFPRQRALAGVYLDHDIAKAARFAAFHHQILAEVVALVQQADGGDAIFNGRAVFVFDWRA
jgi:uncharacterized membrane protein YfbV (UPF0208 family)